ncbi:hypothetical protein BEN78_15160 [Xanthomonas citri pv. mangiferaeindicae]|nr:hypothetical protein BEN78_15160 [Xanthomonas citri pv. mangiferaeindicae]
MKALVRVAILLLPLGMSGCVIGNGRICGPQTLRIYCDKEAFDSLHNRPSLTERWQHPAPQQIERPQDWIACGGSADGGYAGVSAARMRSA